MPRRLNGRGRRLILLCLLLLGAAFGAPGDLGTYTNSTFAQDGGDKVCLPPKNTDCQQWGCNYKNMCVLSGTECPATACVSPPLLEQ